MKIIIFDTEYLSISRRYSGLIGITKFKKKLFPEIIQISFLKLSNVFLSNNKKKKLNLFIKIRQKIPRRISKLTGIRQSILDKKGYLFQDAIKIIDKFIKKKSILIANGDDVKLIKLNLSHNNIKKRKKKLIYFVNLKLVLNKIDKTKNFDTQNLSKIFKFKINFKVHDASNDCKIIYKSIKKLIKLYGRKKFNQIINQNKRLIYI